MRALRFRDPAGAIREALFLLGVSLALAVGLWLARPDRLPLQADSQAYALDLSAPLISVDEALVAYQDGSRFFVDTRAGDPSGRASIPGSFLIREQHLLEDLEAMGDFLFPEDPLILYGAGHPLPVDAVAARLQTRGFENVVILQGGLEAWRRAGGEIAGQEGAHE